MEHITFYKNYIGERYYLFEELDNQIIKSQTKIWEGFIEDIYKVENIPLNQISQLHSKIIEFYFDSNNLIINIFNERKYLDELPNNFYYSLTKDVKEKLLQLFDNAIKNKYSIRISTDY